MKNDPLHAAMSTWAVRDLPARLGAGDTAKLLGFAEHDIQVLMATGKLTPLGDPAPNAPKWFAAIEVIQLATDRDWLNKATREVSRYWRHKHDRQQEQPTQRNWGRRSNRLSAEKVSPKSSPEPSLSGQLEGSEEAVASTERAVTESA
jgi:hypothetical protein